MACCSMIEGSDDEPDDGMSSLISNKLDPLVTFPLGRTLCSVGKASTPDIPLSWEANDESIIVDLDVSMLVSLK